MFSPSTTELINRLSTGESIDDDEAQQVRDELAPVLADIHTRLFSADGAAAKAQQQITGEIVALLEKRHFATSASRQAALKVRREAQGYKRTTLWIHQQSFDQGVNAAQLGSSTVRDFPDDCVDVKSWVLGYSTEITRFEQLTRSTRQ